MGLLWGPTGGVFLMSEDPCSTTGISHLTDRDRLPQLDHI